MSVLKKLSLYCYKWPPCHRSKEQQTGLGGRQRNGRVLFPLQLDPGTLGPSGPELSGRPVGRGAGAE